MEFNSTGNLWVNQWHRGVLELVSPKGKISAGGVSFFNELQSAGQTAETSGVENYRKYLEKKYGNVTIESVGKDRESLEKLGKSMSGNDVVIASNIFEQMANDPKKAAYYEQKIDYFFADIPRQTALCAAKGLDYQPCGVVIHEDGSVTYISGCADSPERVAEVNEINNARSKKRAAMRRASLERSLEEMRRRRQEQRQEMKITAWTYCEGAEVALNDRGAINTISDEKNDPKETETKSDIIVKPDGSRVLVVTMKIGGMETNISLEISKPTDMVNDCRSENQGGDAEQNINADFSHHFNNIIT